MATNNRDALLSNAYIGACTYAHRTSSLSDANWLWDHSIEALTLSKTPTRPCQGRVRSFHKCVCDTSATNRSQYAPQLSNLHNLCVGLLRLTSLRVYHEFNCVGLALPVIYLRCYQESQGFTLKYLNKTKISQWGQSWCTNRISSEFQD